MMDNRITQGDRQRQRGAALLLTLFILTTIGLAFFFKSANTGTSYYAREKSTEAALAAAKSALIGFAATYRDTHPNEVFGYLLCPDTNNDGKAQPNCGSAGETMIGRLPYKTLELPDLQTAGGECLWYIVSGSHKNNPKSPLNWDTRGKIRIEDMNGAALIDPNDDAGGAVAAIIAPGSPLAGQNRPTGGLNCSGDASNSFATYLDGSYIDALLGTLTVKAGQSGSTSNNDRVAWISARELFAPIAKRIDLFGNDPNTLFADLNNCFESQAVLPLPTNPAPRANGYTKTAFLGDVVTPVNFPSNLPGCTLSDSAWKAWKNQFGYVVCDDQSVGCLDVEGILCRGALIFSGRQDNGNPRASSVNFDVILGNTFIEEPNLTSYLSAGASYIGDSRYAPSTPSRDIVRCLKP